MGFTGSDPDASLFGSAPGSIATGRAQMPLGTGRFGEAVVRKSEGHSSSTRGDTVLVVKSVQDRASEKSS